METPTLTFSRCLGCGTVFHYPRVHCPQCGSHTLEPRASAGRGTIYSSTVVRVHPDPTFRDILPVVVAYVDLDEGFRVLADVRAADLTSVAIGDVVTVAWRDGGSGPVPFFFPVDTKGAAQ